MNKLITSISLMQSCIYFHCISVLRSLFFQHEWSDTPFEELDPNTTISKMETVVDRGIRGEVKEFIDFYFLDAIIVVGYRVSSPLSTTVEIQRTI